MTKMANGNGAGIGGRQVRIALFVAIMSHALLAVRAQLTAHLDSLDPNPFEGRSYVLSSIELDIHRQLEGLLTRVYDNNVELTRKTLQMLDELPTDEETQDNAIKFIKEAHSLNTTIWIRVSAIRLSKMDDLLKAGFRPYRPVLLVYLRNLLKRLPKVWTTKANGCFEYEPKTFLNCCKSPCRRCRHYQPAVAGRRADQPPYLMMAGDGGGGHFGPEGGFPPGHSVPGSSFFSPAEMRAFVETSLTTFDDRAVQEAFWWFLVRIKRVFPSTMRDYLDNMLSLLASLGVPMDERRFNSRNRWKTEPGFAPLTARLSALARRIPNDCEAPRSCQLAPCERAPPRIAPSGVTCLPCRDVSQRDPPRPDQGFPAPEPKLPPPSSEPTVHPPEPPNPTHHTSNPLTVRPVAPVLKTTKRPPNMVVVPTAKPPNNTNGEPILDYPKMGTVDPEKLKINYSDPAGFDESYLIDEARIEYSTLDCSQKDAPTCLYKETCGAAPLNMLTPPRKKASPYVVNGEDQSYGEWPSFVKLEISNPADSSRAFCGGTLISDRHVLTGMHCLMNVSSDIPELVPAHTVKAYLADHQIWHADAHEVEVSGRKICASKGFLLPDVSQQAHDDWAVLELMRPVAFSDYIQPACLPFEPLPRTGPKAKCFLVGAGVVAVSADEGEKMATTVQKMRVDQVSCRAWRLSDRDRSRECYSKANRNEGDSCSGDSGGPILCLDSKRRWTVVASVSYGNTKCNDQPKEAWIGVYTRYRTLLADIKEQCKI